MSFSVKKYLGYGICIFLCQSLTAQNPNTLVMQRAAADSVDFKITTLNSEWLSCSQNGPTDEELQISNIATLIKTINPDVIGLQEVGTSTSYASVDTLLKKLGTAEWGGNIVAWSADNCSQNQAIIYKKAKVQLSGSALLTGAGSSYNWSSGRYPVLFSLIFAAGRNSYAVSLINIHAKASSDATSYGRRAAASVSLKSLLDGSTYKSKNIILLGDYNDYLVGSQCKTSSDSPYKNFVDDATNYRGLTSGLYDSDYNSPVIDNFIISNELFGAYVSASAKREEAALQTIANYSTTTTDHTPVSITLRFKSTTSTNIHDMSDTESLLVYPNPVVEQMHIRHSSNLKAVQVLNLAAVPVISFSGNADMLDLSSLSPGVYLLKVTTEGATFVRSIIKK